jgi:4'-phosphopantetheinyl transferase
MPLYKIINYDSTTQILVWKTTETFDDLFNNVILNESNLKRLNSMKSTMHQRGFLSVRKLMQEAGYTDLDLFYDEYGKPHLKDGKHISISHSFEFSTIVISNRTVGIDLELVKEKVLKIASRFMNISHLEGLSEEDKIKKATVIWGIKEAIFKIKNQKGISFPDHIFENPFSLNDSKGVALLRFNNKEEHFNFKFEFIENYTLVYTFKN